MNHVFDYEGLSAMGYNSGQINQLLILRNYYDEDEILKNIGMNVDIDILRNVNNYLKVYGKPYDKNVLYFIGNNEDPVLYLEEDSENGKCGAVYKILSEKVYNKKGVLSEESELDFDAMISFIKGCKLSHFTLDTICDDFVSNIDALSYVREDFNDDQIHFARRLYVASCECFIEDIPKLNSYPPLDFELFQIIKDYQLDFPFLINTFKDDELRIATKYLKEGYELEKYVEDGKFMGNLFLFKKMVDMKLSDENIRKFLKEIPYQIKQFDIDKMECIINAKLAGCPVEKYFSILPLKYDVELLTTLFEAGYNERKIDEYLKLIFEHLDGNILEKKDILKIIELYNEGYKVDNLIASNMSAENINYILKLQESGLNINDVLSREFRKYEMELLDTCRRCGRDDVAKCVIYSISPDQDAYTYIGHILEWDKRKSEHHKVVNLFFDKGFDTFREYEFNSPYEFSEEQKLSLVSIINDKLMDDTSIDLIRDNAINDDVMYEIAEMYHDGIDISGILQKADNLSYHDITAIRTCIKLGFDVTLREKNIEKEK